MESIYKVLDKNDLIDDSYSCEIYWDKIIILHNYEVCKKRIYEMKFLKQYYLIKELGKGFGQHLPHMIGSADIITAVPMYWRKRIAEGENHAEIIARFFADIVNVKYKTILRVCNQLSTEQKKMDRVRRFVYKVGRYRMKKSNVENKSVVIVDDVVTTGATVNECARIIKKNGAKKVIILALSGLV